MLIVLILILTGLAHDGERCPSFPQLERLAASGRLDGPLEECLTKEGVTGAAAENLAWVIWLGRWRSSGERVARDREAKRLLAGSVLPTRSLWAAQILAEDNPVLALAALDRVEALALHWGGLSDRIERLAEAARLRARLQPHSAVAWVQRFRSMGVVGPLLDEAMAACQGVSGGEGCLGSLETGWLEMKRPDHWMACQNTMRLWSQRLGGRAYGSERDCMIAAAYLSETGPGRSVGVRLAILLSMGREEPHVTGAVLRLFEVEVSAEPELVKMAADFHREQGDVLGAVWWEARASVLR